LPDPAAHLDALVAVLPFFGFCIELLLGRPGISHRAAAASARNSPSSFCRNFEDD
jgi:hypothetical protein